MTTYTSPTHVFSIEDLTATYSGVQYPALPGMLDTAGTTVEPYTDRDGNILYAIDSETGETLWSGDLLGNQGTSNPMTYRTSEGKQIVVIGVTGPGSDRGMIAFALPGA